MAGGVDFDVWEAGCLEGVSPASVFLFLSYGSAEEVVEDELVGVHAEHDDAVPQPVPQVPCDGHEAYAFLGFWWYEPESTDHVDGVVPFGYHRAGVVLELLLDEDAGYAVAYF